MSDDRNELNASAQLTAYALGQLAGEERAACEAALRAVHGTALEQEVQQIQALAAALAAARAAEPTLAPSVSLREAVAARLTSRELSSLDLSSQETAVNKNQPVQSPVKAPDKTSASQRPFYKQLRVWIGGATAAALLLGAYAILVNPPHERQLVRSDKIDEVFEPITSLRSARPERSTPSDESPSRGFGLAPQEGREVGQELASAGKELQQLPEPAGIARPGIRELAEAEKKPLDIELQAAVVESKIAVPPTNAAEAKGYAELVERGHTLRPGEQIDARGLPQWERRLKSSKLFDGTPSRVDHLYADVNTRGHRFSVDRLGEEVDKFSSAALVPSAEQYESIVENRFLAPAQQPLSTFSIDVDTASYANIRRFLTSGRLPPPNAVRIEELVNYFTYDYPQPKAGEPFSVNMEAAACPWQPGHLLLRVGLKGKEVHKAERPASNLVFLLDVSGSMSDQNKLPLLKTAMQMLTGELTENDRVTIVTYAGHAGLVLEPTAGSNQRKIHAAIEQLSPGGSTNGSAGIQLAYEQAAAGFLKEGTNRVILATDGDLNVGITSDEALVKLIQEKAAGGVFLTVLGFGEGNLKDAKMEKLADNGNGVYAYIDSVREARKVLVEQMSGSLVTIAKDVKIQIEFNPAQIASYRLLGYENRILAAEDFNNDKKDAGEIGAGHTVTALYELVPVGAENTAEKPTAAGIEPLRYQQAKAAPAAAPPAEKALTEAAASGELLTLKLRYKAPDGDTSKLLEYPLKDRGGSFNSASPDLQFAAAVASFGMILRNSEHRGSGNISAVAEIAAGSLGKDPSGYRAEFLDLVNQAKRLGVN